MKIYTKKGDSGTTSSFSGRTYRKDDTLIELNGLIDETIVSISLAKTVLVNKQQQKQFNKIIEAMYLLGAEVSNGKTTGLTKYIDKGFVTKLEDEIDSFDYKINGFMYFSTKEALYCEEARVKVRKLERFATKLLRHEQLRETIYAYLNRLSDYLFVVSICLEKHYKGDELLEN